MSSQRNREEASAKQPTECMVDTFGMYIGGRGGVVICGAGGGFRKGLYEERRGFCVLCLSRARDAMVSRGRGRGREGREGRGGRNWQCRWTAMRD